MSKLLIGRALHPMIGKLVEVNELVYNLPKLYAKKREWSNLQFFGIPYDGIVIGEDTIVAWPESYNL